MLKIDTQLSKVYFEEALKEAAQSRADRKANNGSKAGNNPNRLLFLMVMAPILVWFFKSFIAG